ncbi:Protein of unknown function [Pyronema omphalodes CBS 100304]|uniref:Uncharacterized protein n=1 Tax=Pyronema omphalodes (strain CBS 100304) TaxID=1076935 RepID=U4LFJ1_PYROM|nr:Protein of unknown function [Pyronema omphalodes CBS 100304]
MGVQLRRLDRC